ncbi:MAG: glycosyltransferase, partial [Plesiomonas sp.]
MSQHATLSIILIVKNEAENLQLCLESVRELADEIIVLDSGSQDGTEDVARHFTDKFYINTPWPGFGRQRQIAQAH